MIAFEQDAKVEEYVEWISTGKIAACNRVKRAVARYLRDLERQSTDDFPYHFDRNKARKACEFFKRKLKHSKGKYAGRPIELEPWQAFAIWNIFGWKRDDDNSRRFRKVYWSMARKNGKSTIAAGVAMYIGAVDVDPATGRREAVGEIYFTATKKEQADVVYSEASRMRSMCPDFVASTIEKDETIFFNGTGTQIKKLAYDKKGFDGLNPTVIVMDELHKWTEFYQTFYDTLITGSMARTQPLHLIITTAGDDKSELWLRDYRYACDVLDGNYSDDSLFAIIYELDDGDDIEDESVWIKANPNLGISVSTEALRTELRKAKRDAIGRASFKRYMMNTMVSNTASAFDMDVFDECVGQLSDWNEADAIGCAFDMGALDDFAAYALCARFVSGKNDEGTPIYRYEVKTKSYISKNTKRDLSVMPFCEWVFDGQLIVSRYPTEDMTSDIIADCEAYGISTLAFDPNNGKHIAEIIDRNGITGATFGQNCSMFNEPIRQFLHLLAEKRITFEKSSLLRWCASNAVIFANRNDNWMFDKRTSRDKIDPIVAAVMAYRIASLQPERASGSLFIG